MKSNKQIRSFLAGFLLLVFCLGITPKQILHDIVTSHKHVPGQLYKTATISKMATKYVCDFHNQVAESPFVSGDTPEYLPPVVYLIPRASFFTEDEFAAVPLHADLRGPPAHA